MKYKVAKNAFWQIVLNWASTAEKPSDVINEWLGKGLIAAYFPELHALIGVPQNPEHHPEGDVWTHVCCAADWAAGIAAREGLQGEDRAMLVLASLLHDVGKPETTTVEPDGRVHSPGHPEVGAPIAETLLKRAGAPKAFRKKVAALVKNHMKTNIKNLESLNKLAMRTSPATLRMLAFVMEADSSGRPPLPTGMPQKVARMLRAAKKLGLR